MSKEINWGREDQIRSGRKEGEKWESAGRYTVVVPGPCKVEMSGKGVEEGTVC